jgi:hypothetical protein
VFLTLCHMLACTALGILFSATSITPTKRIRSFGQLMRVGVLSAVFCLTVVLGNVSLKYIPISFNQAIGSTTPFFTAVFAFLMQGARLGRTLGAWAPGPLGAWALGAASWQQGGSPAPPSTRAPAHRPSAAPAFAAAAGTRENTVTYSTLIPIAAGVVIASGGEPLFHTLGLVFCLLATAGRALKSVVRRRARPAPCHPVHMAGASPGRGAPAARARGGACWAAASRPAPCPEGASLPPPLQVQSMLMSDSSDKLDPMSLLLYMSLFSIVLLIPTTLVLEMDVSGHVLGAHRWMI